MLIKISKYSKSPTGLPVLITEYEVADAMVFDEEPIIEEVLELNQFFEFGVPSMDLTLDSDRLDDAVKSLFSTESLNTYIIGLYFEDGNNIFSGYITEESVEYDEITKDYLITGINWWKYFYDEMADHYCPAIETPTYNSGVIKYISEWLEEVFLGDVIKNVVVDLSSNGINVPNYQQYAHSLTIQEMLNNIHKKLVSVFIFKNDTLYLLQLDKGFDTSTTIDSLIENQDYMRQFIVPTDYDSVVHFGTFNWNYYFKNNGEFVGKSLAGDSDLSSLPDKANYLDLRTKKVIVSTIFKDLDDSDRIQAISGNLVTIETTPVMEWIGKIITAVDSYLNTYGSMITNIYPDTKQIEITWWGKLEELNPNGTEPAINSEYKIYDTQEIIIEEGADRFIDIPYSAPNFSGSNFITEDLFLRIFNPKGRITCTVNADNISFLEKAKLDEVDYRIISATKNVYTKSTELELEKIDSEGAA